MFKVDSRVMALSTLALAMVTFSPRTMQSKEVASPDASLATVVITPPPFKTAIGKEKVGRKAERTSAVIARTTPANVWDVLPDYDAATGIFPKITKPPEPPAHPEYTTILLLGVDSTGSRTRFVGARSDTTMLLTIEPALKKLVITSIPRDSRVYIKGHGANKINAAHAYGGPKLAAATVRAAFGIPVDRYVVLDTAGLKKVCELIGPLEVVVEKRMSYTDHAGRLRIDLKPGRQLLSPAQVEQYVRFRHDADSDIGRIQRQQWFIRQAFTKLYDPLFLWKLPQIIPVARDSIRTDLSVADMVRLSMSAREIKQREIVTASLPGRPASVGGLSYWLLDMPGVRAIFDRIYDRETTDPAAPITDPPRIAIHYAAGSAQDARALEHSLIQLGYGVKLKKVIRAADCTHEQIVLSSTIVRKTTLNYLRSSIPMIASWPEVIAAQQPGADLTFIIPRRKS